MSLRSRAVELYFSMGLVKRYLDDVEARGWDDVDTMICSGCVFDQALITAIRSHGGTDSCDYCNEYPAAPVATAPIEVILELVVDGLRLEYEDPVEHMGWVGGYVGTVYETCDLLDELGVTERDDVHKDLDEAIQQELWCQRDFYSATPAEALTGGWQKFRELVKHQRRFTFLTNADTTIIDRGELPTHAITAAITDAIRLAGCVKTLPADSQWWRVRAHRVGETYSTAAGLGPPPDTVAKDNRMSPKGIGAFYGASTMNGARKEVAGYAEDAPEASGGRFTTTAPLEVVDLRDPPPIPSLFDSERRHLRPHIEFLHGFVKDATTVAKPFDNQNLDYIPTQIVAETFRYQLTGKSGPVAGILWRSTKDSNVTSCVLFIPSTGVSDIGSEGVSTRLVLDPTTVEHIAGPL